MTDSTTPHDSSVLSRGAGRHPPKGPVGSTTIPLRRAPPGIHEPGPRSRASRAINHLAVPARPRRRRPPGWALGSAAVARSEEHTSELQSLAYLVCRLLLEKKN